MRRRWQALVVLRLPVYHTLRKMILFKGGGVYLFTQESRAVGRRHSLCLEESIETPVLKHGEEPRAGHHHDDEFRLWIVLDWTKEPVSKLIHLFASTVAQA